MANRLQRETGGLFGGRSKDVFVAIYKNGFGENDVIYQKLVIENRKKKPVPTFYKSKDEAISKNKPAKVRFFEAKISFKKGKPVFTYKELK